MKTKDKIIEILRKMDNDGFDDIYYGENADRILKIVKQEIVDEIEKSFEQLYMVKRAWGNIEKGGNPNEQLKTQIFGFNQAFRITDETLQDLIQTLTK